MSSGDVGSLTRVLQQHLLSGQDPGLESLYCAFIDVQDVAEAHIWAATIPEANGKRFLLAQMKGVEVFLLDIASVLREAFSPMIYKISTFPLYAYYSSTTGSTVLVLVFKP